MVADLSVNESPGSVREAAAPGLSLGKNTDFASNPVTQQLAQVGNEPQKLSALTVNAWMLRAVGRELLAEKRADSYTTRGKRRRIRLAFCGARLTKRDAGVSVYRRPDRAYGRVGGVCLCGQSVVCPVCAPRIAAFRAAEVEEAFKRARDLGFVAFLDTYTMPHKAGTSLGVEIDTFADAWRQFISGRTANELRLGYLGNHTAREITFSNVNGWHYHHHQLRYHKEGTHEPHLLRASWMSALQAVGRFTEAAFERGFDSEPVRDEKGARYTAKLASSVDAQALALGMELASSATKGRNIVRLLGDYSRGDKLAGETWLHGVREVCSRKVSSVRWSAGLRDKLGLTCPDLSDLEVAEEKAERTDEPLGELTAMQWKAVIMHRGEFPLVAAAQYGVDAVNTYLSGISAGELHTSGLPEPERKYRA